MDPSPAKDAPRAPPTPDWIAEGFRQVRDELALYLRTGARFALHPARFAEEWASGTAHALNPMGFFATTLGVLGPALVITGRLAHEDDGDSSILKDAVSAVTPFAYYLLLGALQHGILRLFGSRRRLRDSWAMALYAGGGPCTAGTLLLCAYAAIRAVTVNGSLQLDSLRGLTLGSWVLVALTLAVQAVFLGTLALSLWGLHRPFGIRPWHVALTTVAALVGSGLLFGWLRPPGSFGVHLVLHVRYSASGNHWGFGATLGD